MMNIENAEYVKSSELFAGLDALGDEFANSDPPFSWGDNDLTLVDARGILSHLDGFGVEHEDQLETLRERIEGLPLKVCVDLEH